MDEEELAALDAENNAQVDVSWYGDTCDHKWTAYIQFTVPFDGKYREFFCVKCGAHKTMPVVYPRNYYPRKFGDA